MRLLFALFDFYKEGFAHLTLGKTLWKIPFVKLLIMAVVFKLLFFNTTLHTRFSNDEERSDFVLENLTKERK